MCAAKDVIKADNDTGFYVSLLIQGGQLAGGHALIYMFGNGSHHIYHLQGWGFDSGAEKFSQSSSGTKSGFSSTASVVNPKPRVSHFGNAGGSISCSNYENPLTQKNIVHWAGKRNVLSTPILQISEIQFKCLREYCENEESEKRPIFSLLAGAFNVGQNCITWAYNQLGSIGVGFSTKLYSLSFTSPALAVKSGGCLLKQGDSGCQISWRRLPEQLGFAVSSTEFTEDDISYDLFEYGRD